MDLLRGKSTNIVIELFWKSDTDVERVDTPSAPVNILWLLALEAAFIHHVIVLEWLQVHLLPMLVRRSVQLDEELDGLGCILNTSFGTPLFLNIYLRLEVAIGSLYLDKGIEAAFRALD